MFSEPEETSSLIWCMNTRKNESVGQVFSGVHTPDQMRFRFVRHGKDRSLIIMSLHRCSGCLQMTSSDIPSGSGIIAGQIGIQCIIAKLGECAF